MKERVTMARIAREAGVSAMTVSRALRDSPSLPAATRARIKRLAQRLGYRPDPAVAQLMSRLRLSRSAEAPAIAWVTSHATRDGWRAGASNLAIFSGASARAKSLGYRLEPFWLGAAGMTGRRLGEVLLHRGIRGLLVAPLPALGGLDLPWAHFASATCGFSLSQPNLHRACSQQFHTMRVAADELARRGYERVGVVLSRASDDRADGMWLGGFLAQQRDVPARRRVPPLLLRSEGDREAFLRWFQKHRPDAVIAGPGGRAWLLEAGARIPEDCGLALINVVGSDDAGVDHRMEELGAAAADLVIEQLHVHHYGLPAVPKMVMVECRWQDGPSAPGRRPVVLR